ncbi:amidohydrolase [Pseudodonghicola flavimaris]|uniref:Amidohydrolase n=1 Tax=Pseudodonghicola flavimaris TaxID=3050036 RepID=A0ABT7F7W0_9RHOB|nr:amidohydrolase [Pseudodonghicola flavimaris]MDK3020673.1 amidohydrolase [Pseudodonghicola flavimaris]
MSDITLFRAKKIITMDPNLPQATHVAVRDGWILAVGDADCAAGWGDGTVDDSLADSVLMPGFIEGHSHLMAGGIWKYAYAGYHDRIDPEGKLWKGVTTAEEVIAAMKAHAETLPEGAPVIGWGLDPIFLTGERLSRHHLDQVASDRPVAIMFSSFHVLCANSRALEMASYTRESNVEGVLKDASGEPTGELQEMAAMFPVLRRLDFAFETITGDPAAIRAFGAVAQRAGVTTLTDLYASMNPGDVEKLQSITGDDSFPARLVPVVGAVGLDPVTTATEAQALRAQSTEKLRLGRIKLMTDGSIQGWTARVKWPGYIGGQPNGIWNTPPEVLDTQVMEYHKAGIHLDIHVNGDEASEAALDAIEKAQRAHPWPGARHVLQHCQLMGIDQFERCVELGVCCNIFANHIWYFGDQHVAMTVGEDRARRMDALRSALDTGVHVTIHSDAPVTPLAPLFSAWVAVNRRTMSGRVLGAAQCVSVEEALHAVTLGAAYSMRLDREMGSIETGKRADFAVLGDDPTAIDPMAIKDVPVRGTVLGGRVQLL